MKSIVFSIKQQIIRIQSITACMIALSGMIKGSFGTTHHRCGKISCWCANSDVKGHLYTKLMWTDERGPKTRSIRCGDTQTVREAIGQHREFKALQRNLKSEMQRLNKLLTAFEQNTSEQNRSDME